MDQQQPQVTQHLVEIQNEALKRENAMLTRANAALSREKEALSRENAALSHENAELREMYNALKESLDEAIRISRQQTSKRLLEPRNSEAAKDTLNSNDAAEPLHGSERPADDGYTS